MGYQGIAAGTADIKRVLKNVPALIMTDRFDTKLDGSSGTFWGWGRSVDAPWAFAPQREADHGELEALKQADDLMIPWIAAMPRVRLSPNGPTLRPIVPGCLTERRVASGGDGHGRTSDTGSYVV